MPHSLEILLDLRGTRYFPEVPMLALHANFFRWLEQADPALARVVDAGDGVKPFTVSPFAYYRDTGMASFRLTLLIDDLYPVLDKGIRLRPEVDIHGQRLPLADEPQLITARFADLARRECGDSGIILEFRTPASFQVNGLHQPLPVPDLVFGSYVARWNAFAPHELRIDEAWMDWARAAVAVSRFDLRSEVMRFPKYQQIGCVGKVQYRITREPSNCEAAMLDCLADYAFFCGTGHKTTQGMGQTMRLATW
jgi:CRISPR-associated endoribonuclease Cas6